jgi:hypothetical protein
MAVKACMQRWNASVVKTNALGGIASGTEASVVVSNGHCFVALMGQDQPALVFRDGHPEGVGGFLFRGATAREKLPRSQREANASVGLHFALVLEH